ncbi:serine/threonine-protein kinase [Aestuariicoccus sp. MJ-SS9]|uniref:serine/threonine-protein kinase n=1 Tax=Aestuariicoccus sp. MJ-SS9 TaxID=3079855 RepID=UPI00290F5A42|nr:serine/threonine-protein kinase [Aestuariicoccus sp. MJ-SS9]MDU8913557.1 serine/threonine-protein kinase [Aestuariicoccus sp. MJ-SS9]
MTQETAVSHEATAMPVGDELPAGTLLCQGQFRIKCYLNAGGFGITYLAYDSLNRNVVIKECFPGAMCCRAEGTVRLRSKSHEMDFERVVALFEREARALAQLQHPNIVGVHQIFQDNGTAYMAMDYIDGRDLFEVLEDQPEPFSPEEVERILGHLLSALSFVHKNGILHRDISPDNILLTPDGQPVLIDFGAARESAVRATRVLSRIHTVKDGYSPQEFYLSGSAQDQSSDLYALAATIHHLITGYAPPNSNHRLAAVAQNKADPYEPLAGTVPGYSHSFLSAIDTCLSLFSSDRLASADEWAEMIAGNAAEPMIPNVTLGDDVKRRISQLVAETTSYIESSEGGPKTAEAQSVHAIAPEPEPRDETRDYWAQVNRELAELRGDVECQQALGRQPDEADVHADTEAGLHGAGRSGKAPLLRRLCGWFAPPRPSVTDTAMQPVKE